MVNFKPEIKPTHRIIQLISRIERSCGIFNATLNNVQGALEDNKTKTIQLSNLAAVCLDQTSPAQLTNPILSFFKSNSKLDDFSSSIVSSAGLESLSRLEKGFHVNFELSEKGLTDLFKQIVPEDIILDDDQSVLRSHSLPFFSHANQRVFTTVSPFLVPRRFRELIEWAGEELDNEELHPLLTLGIFHLLFLQLHPFRTANHRVALLTNWHLLREQGYTFVEFGAFFQHFLGKSSLYYRTLRHAENSTFGDWSTLGVWLELYLSTLLETITDILSDGKKQLNESLLNDTQRKIIETIREHGSLNREKIVSETGINLSTIKYNLTVLSERGHLIKEGGGRSTCYRVI